MCEKDSKIARFKWRATGSLATRLKALIEKLGRAITPETEEFINQLTPTEIVLTNLCEENNILAIRGLCNVTYYHPDDEIPSPGSDLICRYKLDIDIESKIIEWVNLTREGDLEQPESEKDGNDEENEEGDDANTVDTALSGSGDESESGSSVDTHQAPIQEGAGGAMRGEILVGSRYPIGPFVPDQQVASRGPQLVYRANSLTDEEMLNLLGKVSELHNSHLTTKGMTMLEPYTPLRQDHAEALMRDLPEGTIVTGSTMSTASMLGGKKSQLLKECSPDAILEVLGKHNYDTSAALATLKDNMDSITNGWTRTEKDMFDDGFRCYEGELRKIAQALKPTKSMQDVVDYHYRIIYFGFLLSLAVFERITF